MAELANADDEAQDTTTLTPETATSPGEVKRLRNTPSTHASTWDAAKALEGEDPKVRVYYTPKAGGEEAMKAGTVHHVLARQGDPDNDYAPDTDTVQIRFTREDGQKMWVENGELHTQRARHTLVGHVTRIKTSTSNTVPTPTPPEDLRERLRITGRRVARQGGTKLDVAEAVVDRVEEIYDVDLSEDEGEEVDEAAAAAGDVAAELAESEF